MAKTYEQELLGSMEFLHDHCLMRAGWCASCECKEFCSCDKLMDYSTSTIILPCADYNKQLFTKE